MAIKVETFRSISGLSHDSERDAWIDDLDYLINALTENKAMTTKVVSGLISNPGPFREALGAIDRLSQPQLEFDPIPDSIKPGGILFDPNLGQPYVVVKCNHSVGAGKWCNKCRGLVPTNV